MHSTSVSARHTVAGLAALAMPVEPPPPRLRLSSAGGGRPGRTVRAVLFACALGGLAGAVGELAFRAAPGDAPPPASAPPPKPVWLDVNRPIHLFELSGSDFSRLPLAYRARRREPTGERQDMLTYGEFGQASSFFALSVLRRGEAPLGAPDFFVSMVRVAGEAGLSVTRNALPALLPSRFGPFATADLTLADASTSLSCLGFRLQPAGTGAPVDIAGLACRPGGKGMDRALLSCVLDRIDLLSAGDDDDLRGFFVEAERRRGMSCGTSPLLAAGSRPLWLDGDATPPGMRHLPGSRVR